MEGSLVAYKVFTNGSVLPASDVNTYLMDQSVMVFSSSATRAAALTAPVEGMLTWLQDTNKYENYNGTAWVALGTPGLELIKVETIGTTVSSIPVASAFSTDYDNYKVIIQGGTASTTGDLSIQMTGATTGYYSGTVRVVAAGTGSFTGQSNQASMEIGRYTTGTNQPSATLEIMAPFQAARTTMTSTSIFGDTTNGPFRQIAGFLNNTTSYTGFTILAGTGTLTGGTISVYGYRKA
jgi:hypothetical protein